VLPQQLHRHREHGVPGPAPGLHGRVRAGRVPLHRPHLRRAVHGGRHHDPDPPRHSGHPRPDGPPRPGQLAGRPGARVHRDGAAAGGVRLDGVLPAGAGRAERRRADRRLERVPGVPDGRGAGEARTRGHRRVHHAADLERPLVPVDPHPRRERAHGDAGHAAVPGAVRHRLERRAGGADVGGASADRLVHRLLAAVHQRADVGGVQVSRVRVGLVGAGFMASVHAAGWAGCPGVELTAVVTAPGRSPARLAGEYGLRACDSLDELLDLVDVVDVCAPTDVHHQITVRAARAGRAVICEKPLARTPAQAEDMIATCREAGVTLLPAHVVRFFPEYAAAKAAVDAGDIGEPGVVRLTRATFLPPGPGSWYTDHARSGGLAFDLMVHDFDYARWVAGDVVGVYARSVRAMRPDAEADHVLAILRHASGAISHVEGSWAHPPP